MLCITLFYVYIEGLFMKTFNEYAEKAIVRYGLTGYNNLARELGMTKSSISMLRSGKAKSSENDRNFNF